ncbi:MAG: hypothetical protein WHS38_00400 [Thermodesulforhabdaceae bacterium]
MDEKELIEEVKNRWLKAQEIACFLRNTSTSYQEEFRNLIREYESAIDDTAKAMKEFGVWDECALCGKSPKGSCCAPEVALWYDVETLTVNVLMGCELPSSPFYLGHCLFLGERGCLLKARHYFCVHFLCPNIERKLGADAKSLILKVVGQELLIGLAVISWLYNHVSAKILGAQSGNVVVCRDMS